MTNYYHYNDFDDAREDSYPEFFFDWDNAVSSGQKPGFYEPDELIEIIEIYITQNDISRASYAVEYALSTYPDNEEILYDILMLLNDYELWNDLLSLCEKQKEEAGVYGDGHKLCALLHLGMEDEAFAFFRQLKIKYADDKEEASIIYQAMGEALQEMDLFNSTADVMQEAIDFLGIDVDFYWLQLQSYASLKDTDKVIELTEKIQKLRPLDAESWYRQGVIFRDMDEKEKSIEAFEFAQSLGYNAKENLMNLIYAYEKNDNFSKALEKAKEYLILYPDNYAVNLIAAKLCSDIDDWEEAINYINNTIKVMPEMDSLYLYKSKFFLNLQEYKKAKLTLIEGIDSTKDAEGELKKELKRLNELFPDL
jgi:tetratricopeptide (TPR) repeat protein